MPSNTTVVAVAKVEQLEGRKVRAGGRRCSAGAWPQLTGSRHLQVWMTCALVPPTGPGRDGEGAYIRSRALFVHPRYRGWLAGGVLKLEQPLTGAPPCRPQVAKPLSWLSLLPWPVTKALMKVAKGSTVVRNDGGGAGSS